MRVGDPREVAFGTNHLHSANVHLLPPFLTIDTYLHIVMLRPLKTTPNIEREFCYNFDREFFYFILTSTKYQLGNMPDDV